ncbi:hypothetical protein, partial [Pseudomonas koreensis]|uniref:hypothetical protein n=1 Tax=Pseudomonas koreensis TaxID=198620 RepID=UPI001961C943
DAVGDGWIKFRAKTMRYFLFDKSCRRLRSFDLAVHKIKRSQPSAAPTLESVKAAISVFRSDRTGSAR